MEPSRVTAGRDSARSRDLGHSEAWPCSQGEAGKPVQVPEIGSLLNVPPSKRTVVTVRITEMEDQGLLAEKLWPLSQVSLGLSPVSKARKCLWAE